MNLFGGRSLASVFYLDLGQKDDFVLLVGSGRSGTTWVEEILAATDDYRIMFEPFHSRKVSELAFCPYRKYVSPEEEDLRFERVVENILGGRIRSWWIDRFNTTFLPRKRLIKDIRCHLFLGWLMNKWAEAKVIYLMRHPMSVAVSRRDLGWGRISHHFFSERQLVSDELFKFEELYMSIESDLEDHVFAWCVENYVGLKQSALKNPLTIFYEDLCLSPKESVDRVLDYLEICDRDSAYKQIRVPSALSQARSAVKTGGDLLGRWKAEVTDDELGRCINIIEQFGLDVIYREGSVPLTDAENVLDIFSGG